MDDWQFFQQVSEWLRVNGIDYSWVTVDADQNAFTLCGDHENCVRLTGTLTRQGGKITDERKSKTARYTVLECKLAEE